MNLGSDVVITITGIVLVFAILILLMLIITLEGKIFDGMAAKKKAAKEPAAPKAAAKPAAPVQQAAPAPVVEEGIPGDVVAAIMAAIHKVHPIVKHFMKGNKIIEDLPWLVEHMIYDDAPDNDAVLPRLPQ